MTAIRNGFYVAIMTFYVLTFSQYEKPNITEWTNPVFERTAVYVHPIRVEFEVPRFRGDYILYTIPDAYDGLFEITYKSRKRIDEESRIYFPTFKYRNSLGCLLFFQKVIVGEKLPLVVVDGYDVTNRVTNPEQFTINQMRIWAEAEREAVFDYFSELAGTQRYLFDIAATKHSINVGRPVIVELQASHYIMLYGYEDNIFYVYDTKNLSNVGATLYANDDGTFIYRDRFVTHTKGVVVEC